MRFEHVKLENGLSLVAEIHPAAHSAAVGVFVDAGSRDESDALAGVSHFLEHMAFKGTPRRSAADVNRELDEMGSHSNARTGEERTIYHASVLPDFVIPITELLCDLMRPSLRTEDFETEKKVIIEEILMYEDQPPFGGHERIMASFFHGHPLSRSVLGTVDSITAMTPEGMHGYFESRYAADQITIAFAGKIDWHATVHAVAQATQDWQPSGLDRVTAPAQTHLGFEVLHRPQAAQQYLLQLAASPHAKHPDRYAARLAATILGDDSGSRLFWDLVDPGAAEYAVVGTSEYEDAGLAMTVVCCEPEDMQQNLEILSKAQQRLASGDVTEDELERARRKTISSILLQSERPENRMFSVGGAWLLHREYRTPREVAERYRRVTLDDIRRVVAEFPIAHSRTLAVGPLEPDALQPVIAIP